MASSLVSPDVKPALEPMRWLRFLASKPFVIATAGLLAVLICLARGGADAFLYDANFYWSGSSALAARGNFYAGGLLSIRGALTTLPYLPAVWVSEWTSTTGRSVVLAENALLIAVIGVFVIPAILKHLVTVTRFHVLVSALLTAFLLAGFAPFPLMDLWGVAFALAGVALLLERPWWMVALGGVAFAVAANLRPAYLLPAAAAFLIWAVFRWRSSYWPIIGAVLGTLPQIIVNLKFSRSWLPMPIDAGDIANVQTEFASYVVRYDTVAYVSAPNPQQFYCSPEAALGAIDNLPTNLLQLAVHYLQTLPTSILLVAEKIGASLQWSPDTPYAAPPSAGVGPMTLLISAITVTGLLVLVNMVIRRKSVASGLIILGVWAVTVLTIVGSTPETRFALPLVLIGVVGCLAIPLEIDWRARPLRVLTWSSGAVVLSILVIALGIAGTGHPAVPGMVTAASCASQDK